MTQEAYQNAKTRRVEKEQFSAARSKQHQNDRNGPREKVI